LEIFDSLASESDEKEGATGGGDRRAWGSAGFIYVIHKIWIYIRIYKICTVSVKHIYTYIQSKLTILWHHLTVIWVVKS